MADPESFAFDTHTLLSGPPETDTNDAALQTILMEFLNGSNEPATLRQDPALQLMPDCRTVSSGIPAKAELDASTWWFREVPAVSASPMLSQTSNSQDFMEPHDTGTGSPLQISRAPSHELDVQELPDQSRSSSDDPRTTVSYSRSDPGPHAHVLDKATEKVRARDRNREAQRRFRQRQRTAGSMRLVADMTARLEAMALRQSELELRNQVLEHTVRLSSRHVQQLGLAQTGVGGPELDRKQQQLMMLESTHVWSRVLGTPLQDYTLEYCCQLPFGNFMDEEFPALIHRLRGLLDQGGWNADSPAGQELKAIINLRHKEEYRNALFSRWFVALAAWNDEIMRDPAVSPPAASFWGKVLAGLRLEPQQAAELVSARHVLMRKVLDIRQARGQIVLALGASAVDPDADLSSSTDVKRLHASLEEEREAVLDFLYKVIDDCLTPAQEAYLDTQSCPWWPDLWHMTGLLAPMHPRPFAASAKKLPSESSIPAATAPPHLAMFELLRRPQLALGQGLIYKRGLVSVPVAEDALWKAPPPMPSIAQLRSMKSIDVMCGSFWDQATQDSNPLPARASKLPDEPYGQTRARQLKSESM